MGAGAFSPWEFCSVKLTISDLGPDEEGAWDGYVTEHPAATMFHRAGWRRVIARTYGHRTHYLLARRGGSLCGVLPLVEVRSPLFGHSMVSVGFFVYGGIVANDGEAEVALAGAALELGRSCGVGYVELRSLTPLLSDWITKDDLYATFRQPLEVAEAAALARIPRKKRADVRKSLNSGLVVDVTTDTNRFYDIYAQSVHNLGTPVFPRRLIHTIRAEFGPVCELSLVRKDNEPLAALLSFYFRDEVLPYFGGALPAARPLHAYDLLYWSLMRRAVGQGASTMDFGRSKRGTGAFAYKTYWGFEPTPLAYQFKLMKSARLPEVNPLNPKYRQMVAMWRRLPLGVANRLGPMLARQIG